MLRAQQYHFIKQCNFYGLTGVADLKIGDKSTTSPILPDSFYFIDLHVLGSCGCVSGERGLNPTNLL